jgi:2-polyprenyl-3-methyl-5-hydroxy-6-metoxy-1,4-benzoquinol methylase
MMSYLSRSTQKEWMDLGPDYYTPQEYEECLCQLNSIGSYLGGDAATLRAIRRLPQMPKSILDVGCGGGFFTIKLAKHYPQAHVTGIDIAPEAIAFARRQLQNLTSPQSNITFSLPSTPQLNYVAGSFDIVTATLVCHHLSDDELVLFLRQAYHTANQAVVINDLHRHPLASRAFSTRWSVVYQALFYT